MESGGFRQQKGDVLLTLEVWGVGLCSNRQGITGFYSRYARPVYPSHDAIVNSTVWSMTHGLKVFSDRNNTQTDTHPHHPSTYAHTRTHTPTHKPRPLLLSLPLFSQCLLLSRPLSSSLAPLLIIPSLVSSLLSPSPPLPSPLFTHCLLVPPFSPGC